MTTGTEPRTDRDGRFARTGSVRMEDGLGVPARVPHGGLRHRVRSSRALYGPYRIAVFVAGLLCIAIGVALAALPGPLTIPPMLVGLWIWSTEFRWADRFFELVKGKARDAWAHARAHPVTSSLATGGGIAAAAVAFWSVQRFDLVDRAQAALF